MAAEMAQRGPDVLAQLGVDVSKWSTADISNFLPALDRHLAQTEPSGEGLEDLPVKLQGLSMTGHDDIREQALEKLGTVVGANRKWQCIFRTTGILGYSVMSLFTQPSSPINTTKQWLRIVGNSVADHDINRTFAVGHLEKIMGCFEKDEELIVPTLGVLFNLCNDFEPGHFQAAKDRIDSTLASLIALDKIPKRFVCWATDILAWTTSCLSPDERHDEISRSVFIELLHGTCAHNIELFPVLIPYLEDEKFVLPPAELEQLYTFLLDWEDTLFPHHIIDVFDEQSRPLEAKKDPTSPPYDEAAASDDSSNSSDTGGTVNFDHAKYYSKLINIICNISATDAYARDHDMNSPLILKALEQIREVTIAPSAIPTITLLANMALSDTSGKTLIDLVQDTKVHLSLLSILATSDQPSLLYAAAGFLNRLALSRESRRFFTTDVLDACCWLLVNDNAAVRGLAAQLMGLLVMYSFENIRHVITESIPDSVTPATIPGYEIIKAPSILYHMVSQAFVKTAPLQSSSMKNASIELGKAISSMVFLLSRTDDPEAATLLSRMYTTPLLARPVVSIFRQKFFPPLRQPALVGLSIMAQSADGVACLLDVIDEGFVDALNEFCGEAPAEVQGDEADREAFRRSMQTVVRQIVHGLSTYGIERMDAALKHKVAAVTEQVSPEIFAMETLL